MFSSIVVITRNRPQMLQSCLENLFKQKGGDYEIIVVDSSSNSTTKDCVKNYSNITYHYLGDVYGSMPMARNVGIHLAKGEIVAFIDDDSMTHPGWLKAMIESYNDEAVGAVGGRALENNSLEWDGLRPIGRILDSTEITSFFCGDPGKTIEVEHLGGYNMSFRATLLRELGGFDPAYNGTNYREETDICLRINRAGYKILFNPLMAIDHLRAPREGVKREFLDPRFQYYNARNTLYLFVKHYGWIDRKPLRFIARSTRWCWKQFWQSKIEHGKLLWAGFAGIMAGLLISGRYWFSTDKNLYPIRRANW